MVAVDMGFLILLFGERGSPDDRARVDYLVSTLEKSGRNIIIPSPALAEYLVGARKATSQIAEMLWRRNVFRVCAFDERAAIECSILMRGARDAGDKRRGSAKDWQVVKFDYQIVAIARVNNARTLYSNDGPLRSFAASAGLQALSLADLQLPPEAAQGVLQLQRHPDEDSQAPNAAPSDPKSE